MILNILFIAVISLVVVLIGSKLLGTLLGSNTEAQISTAKQFIQNNMSKKAVEILLEVQRKEPENLAARYFIGVAYKNLNDLDSAVAEFKALLIGAHFDKEVSEQSVRTYLADIYSLQQKYKAAISEYQEILKKNDKDNGTRLKLAEMLLKMSYRDSAIKALSEILRREPEHREALLLLGRLLLESKRYNDASDYLSRLVQIEPKNVTAHYYLALVKKNVYDYAGAQAEFEKTVRDDDYKIESYLGMGECLEQQGRIEEAVSVLQSAVNSKSDKTSLVDQARFLLANLYVKQKEIELAVAQWKQINLSFSEYDLVKDYIAKYEGVISDDIIKDFFTAGYAEFLGLCKNVVSYMGYRIVDSEKNDNDTIKVVTDKAGKEKNVFFFVRTHEPISMKMIDRLEDAMMTHGTRNGTMVSTANYTGDIIERCADSSIVLIDKVKLSETLSNL